MEKLIATWPQEFEKLNSYIRENKIILFVAARRTLQ
jgi:hypothetical protein